MVIFVACCLCSWLPGWLVGGLADRLACECAGVLACWLGGVVVRWHGGLYFRPRMHHCLHILEYINVRALEIYVCQEGRCRVFFFCFSWGGASLERQIRKKYEKTLHKIYKLTHIEGACSYKPIKKHRGERGRFL